MISQSRCTSARPGAARSPCGGRRVAATRSSVGGRLAWRGVGRATSRSTTRPWRGPRSASPSSCGAARGAAGRGVREERKVDRLATVRFCSARYSVPHRLVGENVTSRSRPVTVSWSCIAASLSRSTRCWRPNLKPTRLRRPSASPRERRSSGRLAGVAALACRRSGRCCAGGLGAWPGAPRRPDCLDGVVVGPLRAQVGNSHAEALSDPGGGKATRPPTEGECPTEAALAGDRSR